MKSVVQYNAKQKVLKKFVRACQDLLINSEHAFQTRRYLNSRLDKGLQMDWKFGYFPSDKHLNDLLSMVSKEELRAIRLYYPKFLAGGKAPHGHFSDHNLVMPFYDVNGDIISILGRCLLSDEERANSNPPLNKYNYSPGCRKDLFVYGLNKAIPSILQKDFIIGVEGQFDCIALHSCGITNAVAFGWANVSRFQMYQLRKYTNNIVLMFDNDEAGQKGNIRVCDKFDKYANIKKYNPPTNYKDIDEFIRKSKDTEDVKRVIDVLDNYWSLNGKES
jgi:DNA primase